MSYVVLMGNLRNGYTAHGPFETSDEAYNYGDDHMELGEDYDVFEVLPVEQEKATEWPMRVWIDVLEDGAFGTPYAAGSRILAQWDGKETNNEQRVYETLDGSKMGFCVRLDSIGNPFPPAGLQSYAISPL